jgi:hypothetical protein
VDGFSVEIADRTQVLRYFDLTLGRIFPFDRLGWNIIVSAIRAKMSAWAAPQLAVPAG